MTLLTALRAEVFEKAGGQCQWPRCSFRADELAHLRHRGMGGAPGRNTPGNVVALCAGHHRRFDDAHLSPSDLNDLLAAAGEPYGCIWPYCHQPVTHHRQVAAFPQWPTYPTCQTHTPVLDLAVPCPYRRSAIAALLAVVAGRR